MTKLPKKSKAALPDFVDANKACRTPAEREQLAIVVRDGWTPPELQEFARLHFFKNGLDYPTALSYRRAIADIALCRMQSYAEAEPGYGTPNSWLKLFRKDGSKPLPPRREGLLVRGRGLATVRLNFHGLGLVPHRVSDDEYAWPGHTEEFRSMIEQRCRDYFNIAPDQPVHVNAWSASYQAYAREQSVLTLASIRETEAVTLSLAPKSRKRSSAVAHSEDVAAFDYCSWARDHNNQGPYTLQGRLKPHFNQDFAGHTPAFREEVAALARKDNDLRPNAYVSPRRWKVACHTHFVIVESQEA